MELVTGGSGSGKSAYSEQEIAQGNHGGSLLYIATMYPVGKETLGKIERHRELRAHRHFTTIECYTNLSTAADRIGREYQEPAVLLECISNLVANELYMDSGAKEDTVKSVLQGVTQLKEHCKKLVIVTNEVNAEGPATTPEMRRYKQVLGELNQHLGAMADRITEVVYGIPVEVKR